MLPDSGKLLFKYFTMFKKKRRNLKWDLRIYRKYFCVLESFMWGTALHCGTAGWVDCGELQSVLVFTLYLQAWLLSMQIPPPRRIFDLLWLKFTYC